MCIGYFVAVIIDSFGVTVYISLVNGVDNFFSVLIFPEISKLKGIIIFFISLFFGKHISVCLKHYSDAVRSDTILIFSIHPLLISGNLYLFRSILIYYFKTCVLVTFYCRIVRCDSILHYCIFDKGLILKHIQILKGMLPTIGRIKDYRLVRCPAICKKPYRNGSRTDPVSVIIILPGLFYLHLGLNVIVHHSN